MQVKTCNDLKIDMIENTSQISNILDKIVSLTEIRDIELFELSFLKTLAELVTTKKMCLYKSINFQEPCPRLCFTSTSNQRQSDDPDNFSSTSSVKIEINNVDVPEEMKQAQDWIRSTSRCYSIQLNDLFFIVYPVMGLKGVVGYLSLELCNDLSAIDHQIVSNILRISHNFYSLLEENQKDKLTGLLNRKTFDSNISKLKAILTSVDQDNSFSGAEKRQEDNHGNKFWLAIMDIDHFKQVNDTFGHIYGDEVLLLLSQVMKKTFRAKDLLFRYGGEEFVAILNVDNEPTAEHILDRFRKAIEAYVFPQVGTMTISIGATQIINQYLVASELVGRADQALYHAKKTGRNKLLFYETLIDQGLLQSNEVKGDIEIFE